MDAAQKIVAELTGMTPDHQALALKFAIETLGLQLPAALRPAVASPDPSPQPTPSHTASSADHSTDIKSFTAMKSPKSDRQFAAVVAYFYQFEAKADDRKEAIDAEIMKDAARLAGWPQVARWRMTLTNAKNAGYLDAAGSGKFKLSSVGENLVAITLPGNGAPGKSKGSSANKKKKASKKSIKKKG
ncbi:MAG TPA: hypothetical protein VNU97_03480 [Rhizomicrobium sp.]|nr:hypothetical protein [Rhizomicrobium sp.]